MPIEPGGQDANANGDRNTHCVMLVKAYQEFEARIVSATTSAKRGAKRDMILDVIAACPMRFDTPISSALCQPSVVRRSRALRELSAEGVVRCIGRGRDATWDKTI